MHREVPLRYALALPVGFAGSPAPSLHAGGCDIRLEAVMAPDGTTASADVSGDPVALRQTGGRRITTVLSLGRPACTYPASRGGYEASRRLRVRSRRRPGRWEVRGAWIRAVAEGTDWSTVSTCTRTTTTVHSGRVRVYDMHRRRSIVLLRGQTYEAVAPGG
jgi:hypothetical protein